MNICMAFFPIDDMGGLINNNNNLCGGLKELGHSPFTKVFLPREDHPRNGVLGGRGSWSDDSKMSFDQRRGYTWDPKDCVPYRGKAKQSAIQHLNSYDLVIWQIPVPTKRKENLGNMDWLDLYFGCNVPQVAYIHDGNFIDGYPWLHYVSERLRGVGCVNHAALHSAKSLSVPYSLTPSPQKIGPKPDLGYDQFSKRTKGFLSLQTFKAWKHVPELVAAVPHAMDIECNLAGKGIDYYYLTSKDKCKWPGVWQRAMDHHMTYYDVITNDERDYMLRQLTCLVDPSWSKKYATIGDHYNRVTVEAIMQGAVPIVRPLGISTNLEGKGEVFRGGENCLIIPQNVTPEQYGAMLSEHCQIPYGQYVEVLSNAVQLLPLWDRVKVAQTFLDLAEGDAEYQGTTSRNVQVGAANAIQEFFNAKS